MWTDRCQLSLQDLWPEMSGDVNSCGERQHHIAPHMFCFLSKPRFNNSMKGMKVKKNNNLCSKTHQKAIKNWCFKHKHWFSFDVSPCCLLFLRCDCWCLPLCDGTDRRQQCGAAADAAEKLRSLGFWTSIHRLTNFEPWIWVGCREKK